MREIRRLDESELRSALSIAAKAYPMMQVSTEQQLIDFETRILQGFNQETSEWYGLFEDGKLLGNMVLYDFTTNYYGKDIKARGIGFVAVDFLHKKQKVAFELLHWYLNDSLQKKYPLAMLYSFRPDFYKKMGFGYGTYCFYYVTRPDCLKRTNANYQMIYLNIADRDAIIAFYQTLYSNIHGMIVKKDKDIDMLLKAPGINIVGYKEKGKLSALLTYRMKADESTQQSTHMNLELQYITPNGLKAALNFLNSQSDQVSEITFSTLHHDFFFNLADIRHNDHRMLREPGFHHIYDAAMGMMYRSLNPVELIIARPCKLDNLRIRFIIHDSFMEVCKRDFIIEWKDSKAKLSKGKKAELELMLDVADFSSWILNAIDMTTLYQYGLVEISDDAYLAGIDQAFYYQQKPICLERF